MKPLRRPYISPTLEEMSRGDFTAGESAGMRWSEADRDRRAELSEAVPKPSPAATS
jgi:hypothetical protein